MKIKKSQLKHIIKEEIKRIVNEQGIRQPGEPMTTSIGHELRMDRDPPVGGGAGFEEMRREAGLSSPKTPVRIDPEEIEPEDEGVHLAVAQDAGNPSGGYVSAGGGIPNWEVDRTGEISFRESRQRKLQRIIEEELHAILSERDLGLAYDIVEPDLPGDPMKGPKEPVEEVPPVVPGSSARGGLRIPGLEAHIASLPEVDPEEETAPAYGVGWDPDVGVRRRGTEFIRPGADTYGVPQLGRQNENKTN